MKYGHIGLKPLDNLFKTLFFSHESILMKNGSKDKFI